MNMKNIIGILLCVFLFASSVVMYQPVEHDSTLTGDGNNQSTLGVDTTNYVATKTDAHPYKVYIAIVSQTGTDDPVATVFENTLGGTPVWTRTAPDVYSITLAGAFPATKTFTQPFYAGGTDIVWGLMRVSDDEMTTSTIGDDGLFRTSFEIRVYP